MSEFPMRAEVLISGPDVIFFTVFLADVHCLDVGVSRKLLGDPDYDLLAELRGAAMRWADAHRDEFAAGKRMTNEQ